MGTTKTALQAGSLAYSWVVAIEGYQYLITDAATSINLRTGAWAGTTYDAVDGGGFPLPCQLGGLFVDLENEVSISPWEPFPQGGSLVIRVSPDAADQFGIDVFKKIHTGETVLASTADADDTTITVKDTSTFAANGRIYIGTESIDYSGKTSTTFTGCTRGKPTPFANGNSGTTFGHYHRVGADPQGVNLQPAVTSSPRVWKGRWVGLWMHRVISGVLDVKSQAQLCFAGRIADYRDDPSVKGATVLECEHVLDYIHDASLGRDQWSAKVNDGVFLTAKFVVALIQDGASFSNPLTVVAGAPAHAGEIQEGTYSYHELLSHLNSWLKYEKDNGRITGSYSFYFGYGYENEGYPARTFLEWYVPGTGTARAKLAMSGRLTEMLGMLRDTELHPIPGQGNNQYYTVVLEDDAAEVHTFESSDAPLRSMFTSGNLGLDNQPRFSLVEERGTFQDQLSTMPATCPIPDDDGLEWGIFLLENKVVIYGAKDGAELVHVRAPSFHYTGDVDYPTDKVFHDLFRRGIDDPPVELKQIFIIDSTFANIVNWLFWSTGTAGYNHATYDVLPFGLGLGIPGDVLGSAFVDSVNGLPCAQQREILVIEKPKRLTEVLRGSLVARWAFLRWKDQHLEFATWKTPTTALALATLDESNKASAPTVKDDQRAATVHTDQWQHPIIRWEYDRDLSQNDPGSGFRSDITFEDACAVDDAGGTAPTLTVQLPNVYEADTVHQLALAAKPLLPLFTRGNEMLNRTIDSRFWEGYAAGDVVLFTDGSARDPETGRRSVASRPALIVLHRWDPGGLKDPNATKPSEMTGEVGVILLPVNRTAAYGPCADVDDTAGGAGYNAGLKQLTCYAHHYSESSEAADATNFLVGYKVTVVERDPANPAAPLTWNDIVAGQSGNTLTLTTGLGGFDTAKKYRVVFRDYTNSVAGQQVKTYQADDADYLVENARQPFQYAVGQLDPGTVTANSASDPVELVPDLSFGDGVSRDVGHDLALERTLRALVDYGTAHSSPHLATDTMSGAGATGTYKLVDVCPIYVIGVYLTPHTYRNLSVAPWFRSSDGTSASVRITLARYFPNQDTVNDIDRGPAYREAVFTTSSSSWTTPNAVDIKVDSQLLDSEGFCYLLIECTSKAECRGLAACQVSERKTS